MDQLSDVLVELKCHIEDWGANFGYWLSQGF